MSSILFVMGRPTTDPSMQKAKNSSAEFVSLNIAATQRSQNGENETIYFECYFNKFLGQRLLKAGVKHGTCLMLYGDLDIHAYIHQKGEKAGQAGIQAKINVKDWQFVPSNKQDNAAAGAPQNGATAPNYGAAPNQSAGGYPYQGMQNQAAPNQPMQNGGNYAGAPSVPNAAYSGGYPNTSAGYQGGGYPPQNGAPQNYQAAPAGNGYANNGFSTVPESQMGQLPFPT